MRTQEYTLAEYQQEDIKRDIEAIGQIPIVDSMLEVIARTTGLGFTAIARVTDKRWVACAVLDEMGLGLKPGGELELETTICHEIQQSGEGVIIDNVLDDPLFVNHHTPKLYGFQSYISIPIFLQNGEFFGTLCALDRKPAKLKNPTVIGMFNLYANLISMHLQSIKDLEKERELSKLRGQYIAMLGHDLLNPLTAIKNSATLLLQSSTDNEVLQLGQIISHSSRRMGKLIGETVDLTKARLGGGIHVERSMQSNMEVVLIDVIAEQLAVSTAGTVVSTFTLTQPINFDANRMAQLAANLLANAFKYGDTTQPVKLSAISQDNIFTLSVANAGKKISTEVLERIFQPFSRGDVQPGRQGLGLGLFIASEIARAHDGRLEVSSTDEETRFVLTMPCS